MREASFLVVDGQDPSEDGEGLLVEHIARRRFRHVVRLPYFPETTRRWTVTWFTGHVTLYRSARLASLEVRRGRYFYRLADRLDHETDLLVLASCHTQDDRVDWDYGGARWIITHKGPVTHDNSLVFAARFMPLLRSRLSLAIVHNAFTRAKASAGGAWQLKEKR